VLGVSAATVLRWTRSGDLPALRLPGGGIRFREGALEEWLNVRATPADTLSGHGRRRVKRQADSAGDRLHAADTAWTGLPTGSRQVGIAVLRCRRKRSRKSPFPTKSAALAHYREVIEPQLRGEHPATPDLTLDLPGASCGGRARAYDHDAA
jgi:excisionase family DNA binding protein